MHASLRLRSLDQAPSAEPTLLNLLQQQLEDLLEARACPAHSAAEAAGAWTRLAMLSTQRQQAEHVQGRAQAGSRVQGLACTQDWLWRWLIQNWRQGAWGTILSCFFRILWVPCRAAQEPMLARRRPSAALLPGLEGTLQQHKAGLTAGHSYLLRGLLAPLTVCCQGLPAQQARAVIIRMRGSDALLKLVRELAQGRSNRLPAQQCLCCRITSGQCHLLHASPMCSQPGLCSWPSDSAKTGHMSMDPEG